MQTVAYYYCENIISIHSITRVSDSEQMLNIHLGWDYPSKKNGLQKEHDLGIGHRLSLVQTYRLRQRQRQRQRQL